LRIAGLVGTLRPPVSTLRILSDAAATPFTRAKAPGAAAQGFEQVPHVIAWNLTKRCNLECGHCYISAGSWQAVKDELDTTEGLRVIDQLLAVSPAPMLILSGGEPLLRKDLEHLAVYASAKGATVVVGTNGTLLTTERIGSLKAAGVQGVAVSIDSLRETYHDRFRHGDGALSDTLRALDRLAEQQLDFIVQTTVTSGNADELEDLVAFAAEKGAVSFNLYFLVATGRGEKMRGLSPEQNDALLTRLVTLEQKYRGQMLVRSKCQPQIMRHVHERDQSSPLLNYATRCPCGVQYCRITPEGKVTPCPYSPVEAGDLRTQSFADIWWKSEVFAHIRGGELFGKCGSCEYKEICGGCRARAYAETGDLLGPDESCAYTPSGNAPVVKPREVAYGTNAAPTLTWAPDAEERMRRIPSFVRGVVIKRVEEWAKKNGHAVITRQLVDDLRKSMPVDFSKRLPFFLRGKQD
jgi:AdoMet-dependent heme synthase